MDTPTSQLERLDWAAKALTSESMTTWGELYMVIWSPLFVDWEHLLHRRELACGAIAVAVAVSLLRWFHRRHAIAAMAIGETATGGAFLYLAAQGFQAGWPRLFYALIAPVLIYRGAQRFRTGRQFAIVQAEDWLVERAQVRRWLETLQRMAQDDKVTQIVARTLLQGRISYRFLNIGNGWAMAKFKPGAENKCPIEYRVRSLSEISVTTAPVGGSVACVDRKYIMNGRLIGSH